MLRKKGPSGPSFHRGDDNDKGGKVKRQPQAQSQQRVKSTLLVLAVFALIGFCALNVFKDSTDFDPFGPGGLRSRTRGLLKRKDDSIFKHPSHLPPDSLYHLDVDDCEGNKVSLEQFGGSVSLIVNVASH